jgi:hypothetical protein
MRGLHMLHQVSLLRGHKRAVWTFLVQDLVVHRLDVPRHGSLLGGLVEAVGALVVSGLVVDGLHVHGHVIPPSRRIVAVRTDVVPDLGSVSPNVLKNFVD